MFAYLNEQSFSIAHHKPRYRHVSSESCLECDRAIFWFWTNRSPFPQTFPHVQALLRGTHCSSRGTAKHSPPYIQNTDTVRIILAQIILLGLRYNILTCYRGKGRVNNKGRVRRLTRDVVHEGTSMENGRLVRSQSTFFMIHN